MPLIEEIESQTISAYFSADYTAVRSPGWHLKAIIDDYCDSYDLWHRKRSSDFAENLEEFAVGGFTWERAVTAAVEAIGPIPALSEADPLVVRRIYEHAFSKALNEAEHERRGRRSLIKPGELFHRGIFCTPDGWNVPERCPEEWKCTWSSAANELEIAHPDWMMQIPGYCEALGAEQAILRVFHVNGYYEKGSMGRPVIRCWRLRFAEHEKEENWQAVEQHRLAMIEEGRGSAKGPLA